MEGLQKYQRHHVHLPQLDINLGSLITTVVENMHAVSRMKNETFSVLQYAFIVSYIVKESLMRSSLWSAKYFTGSRSYYTLQTTTAKFKDLYSILPSKGNNFDKADEKLMREWVEPYRIVRQRTVRQESTKDKAGTLPIALYQNAARGNVTNDQEIYLKGSDEYDTDTDSSDNEYIEIDSFVTTRSSVQLIVFQVDKNNVYMYNGL